MVRFERDRLRQGAGNHEIPGLVSRVAISFALLALSSLQLVATDRPFKTTTPGLQTIQISIPRVEQVPKLEDFLGGMVQLYGPRMLRYKGVLYIKGSDRKVIFQGVHQLMGSDLGPKWAPGEMKTSKMVFIGIDLPKDVFLQGLEQCLA